MIKNLVEEHVLASYGALRGHFPDFCGCDMCREDVIVYALNRIPPRYVTSREGTVLTGVALEREQSRAAIDVVMMEGLRKVRRAPRCGRGRAEA